MTISRPIHELSFATHDGTELFYRHWPVCGVRRGAVVMFHRGHEHSGRMAHLADELNLPDFDVFAWDARGHGRSAGPRGYSPSFGALVRDVQCFIDHIRVTHDIATESMAILAQSVGAVLVATWAHDYAPRVRCLVLASPAFDVKLYVPFARTGLRLLQTLRGNFFVNSYVKSKFLTHDPVRQASYDADPLITRPISVNILLALYETAERVVADAQAIALPTQLLVSGADWVVHGGPQFAFFDRLGTAVKEKHVLPGFFHDTFGEINRAEAVILARDFILRQFASPPVSINWRDADSRGATFDEAAALARPLPTLSPQGLYWAATRVGLRLGGLFSDGVRLGHATGFDSGSTLDYVYRDKPSGRGPLGRAIDRQYLASIGWRGIRQRKVHLEELLLKAMAGCAAAERSVRVLDIAAGHGRYVIDAIVRAPHRPESILLRDFSEINVRNGTALIRSRGLEDIARFEQGDAFDRATVVGAMPRLSICIVSGLYELFPDNAMVERSLAGLGDVIEPDGYLIYTGQPWHPQLELIARSLTSHRGGQAWVMRRRTQAEIDQLVATAGFEKIEQRIDEWGIFTVSLARRRTA